MIAGGKPRGGGETTRLLVEKGTKTPTPEEQDEIERRESKLYELVNRLGGKGSFFGWNYRPGRVLCLAADESCMFILRPIQTGGTVRPDALALNAMDLFERFTHRKGDGFYNCFVPPMRRPRFAGELVIVRYTQDKDLVGSDGPAEYEHYFEEPGIAPAYPELWSLGHDQYVIPPGPWRVTERGIEHGRDPRGRALPLFGELLT